MPPKKRKVEDDPVKDATKPPPQIRVTRSQATRLPTVPFHMNTRRSKSTSKERSAHASAQISAKASKDVSAESSSSSTRRQSAQFGDAGEPTRPAKRTRLAIKEAEKFTQTDAPAPIALTSEHSFPTVPSIEDFGTETADRPKRKRALKGSEIAEKDVVNGEQSQSQEAEPPLKRTRGRTRAVESEMDGIDSEQPHETEAPLKKRRAPPVRTGPRKGRGRGRGRKRSPGLRVSNFDDDPTMIGLRERQAALKAAFKAIAIPHAAALEELASRDLKTICRDKEAHKKVYEYEEVVGDLQDKLAERQDLIRKEYEYKKANAISIYEKNKESRYIQHKDNVQHLWHEALQGSMFDYMVLVNSARQAQDDAATEVNDEEISLPHEHYQIAFTRGHNFPRADKPAALRAYLEWPEFIHREEMRKQAGPSFQQSQSEFRKAFESEARNLNVLTVAGKTVERAVEQYPESNLRSTAQVANDEESAVDALVMLADPRLGDSRNAEAHNHYLQPSPISKRTRGQRSTIAIKGRQRSGSVQGQRPLLPAPTAPPESPVSPYVYNNPYGQYPPHMPPMSLPPGLYASPLPPPQSPLGYHPLPPPPPSLINSPYVHMLNGGMPLYPRPPMQALQPYYPPNPLMMQAGPPPQQAPLQQSPLPQPPPPSPSARQP